MQAKSRKSAQDDRWSFSLTAGTRCGLGISRDHVETTAPEPHTGFQGASGACRHQGHRTLAQPAEQFDVDPNQITSWKAQLESGAAEVFGLGGGPAAQPTIDVKSLHAKFGELTLENEFLRTRSPRRDC